MLDLKLVREDPERVKASLAKRGPGVADQVDRLLEADAARRRLVTEVDALRAEQKRRGKEVARAAPEERERLLAGLKELSARLDEAEAHLRAAVTLCERMDARAFLADAGVDVDANLDAIDGRFMAAFVRATKPATRRQREWTEWSCQR